ncbi:hypothetical protein BB050_04087 [Flavobacterium anhuiense]|uniref:RiboL-PSP-HEPN domain-containing protein n=1 Tax=Flavobacterium anhuiense TaxID=459526 RepID=A0AAC9GJZ7_9FLAO|nr:hypothetical protein [Flavobacterium anhuiense]AOC97165.1 hypothetical protein BB050_04087 [Flavobacterium anhuiense]
MDEAINIFKFLPYSYRNQSEQEYITYLWDCYQENYNNQKYQFAFMAYHMLFMSFVYFNLWQVKSIKEDDFNKIKLGFTEALGNAINPYDFSIENERKVFDLLKYVCASHSDVKALIGNYKKLVDERNNIAHANGAIPFRTDIYLHKRINDILQYASEIQSFTKSIIQECFEKFLIESKDEETREYSIIDEQINQVLIHNHYLSIKDVGDCLEYDIHILSDDINFQEIERIYDSLSNWYENETNN